MAGPTRSLPRRPRQEDLEGFVLAGADLRAAVLAGLDLSGRDLSGADLTGADLAGARLAGAVLDRAVLDDADLSRADLSGARVRATSMRRARGAGCVLAGARGEKLDLTGASLPGANLREAMLEGLVATEALLQEVDARGASLGRMQASGAALDLARLDGADLQGAALRSATLEGAVLDGAVLRGAQLERAKLRGARLEGACLDGAELARADLRGARVEGLTLAGARAKGLRDRGVAWSEDQLVALRQGGGAPGPGLLARGAGAGWSWIRGGGPLRALLVVATGVGWPLRAMLALFGWFWGGLASLRAASRARAEARARAARERREALLREVRPEAMDPSTPPPPRVQPGIAALREAARRGADRAVAGARAALGRVRSRAASPAYGPGVDLSGQDLRGENLAGLDLSGARLLGAALESADLRGTTLRGALLDGARLNGARLDGADLEGASAIESFLDEVSFEDANLVGFRAPGARAVRATFVGARFGGTSLVAADLSGASFSDVDLADTNLSGALLEQADLAGARLDRALVRGTELGAALGLSRAQVEELGRRGADVGVFSAGVLSLRRIREFIPRLPSLGRAALGTLGAAPPAMLRALSRALLGLARGLRRAGGSLGSLGAGEVGLQRLLARGAMGLLVAVVRAPRTFVRATERGLLLVLGAAFGAVGGLARGSWLAVRASARTVEGAVQAAADAAPGALALGSRAWSAQVRGAEWALDAGFSRGSRLFGLLGRVAVGTARAAWLGLFTLARGVLSAGETALRLLDSGSSWLESLGRDYDQRLDAAAVATERLARSGVRGLRDLPSLTLRLGRGSAAVARAILAGSSRLLRWVVSGAWRAASVVTDARRAAKPGAAAGSTAEGAGALTRAVAASGARVNRAVARAEVVGLNLDLLVDRAQDGAIQFVVAVIAATGRALAAVIGGASWVLGWVLRTVTPERLRKTGEAGRGAAETALGSVLRAGGDMLDRASIALEQNGEALRLRVEERRQARAAMAAEQALGVEPVAPTAEVVEAPVGAEASPLLAPPPEPRLPPTEDAVVREALTRPPVDVDSPPARLPEPDAESGRLAGLITLLAAALLSVYLGRQFLSVDNLSNPEEDAAEQLALGETDAALARYEQLLGEASNLNDRLSLRWQIAELLIRDARREEALNQLRAAVSDARGEPDAETEAWIKLAEGLRAVGRYDEALEADREALRVDGGPAALVGRALVDLVETHRRLGDPDAGVAEADAFLAALPGPSAVLEIRAEMADRLVAAGDYDRALAGLESTLSLKLDRRQRARALAEIAAVHEARGALRDALAVYEQLVRDYPRDLGADGQTLLSGASVAWRLGFEEQATRWLDLLGGGDPAPRVDAQATLLRARIERDAGRPNTAALLYRQVLQEHPDDREATAAAQLALAETLWAVDDAESAERMYEELTRSGDAELVSQVRVGRGRIFQRKGDADAAREAYVAVLSEFPDSAAAQSARAGLAELEIESGNYNEAITALRELRAKGSGGLEIDAAIADALLKAGRLDEAELAYETLRTGATPNSEAALIGALGLARLAEINGDFERARAGYEQVVAGSPDPVLAGQALEALANFYLDQGREDEAMVAYRDFLRTLPEGHAAIFDTRLAMAQILRRRGELDLAREHYEALLDESSTPAREAEVRVALAELDEARGDFAAAHDAYAALLAESSLPSAHRDDVVVGLVRSTLARGDAAAALELATARMDKVNEASTRDVLQDLRVQALRALGRGDEADALVGVEPEAADPFSLGLAEAAAFVNEGRFDEAIARYEALRADAEDEPSMASIELAIAQTLATAGRTREARVAYQQVNDRYPEEAEVRFAAAMGLAWVDRLEGRPAAAIGQYERLRGPDSDSEVWRLQQLAETWGEAGEPARAEEVYKHLIRDFSGYPGAQAAGREGLASILRANGDLQAARALYEQVMRQAPDADVRARARLNAAMILVDEGRPDQAKESLEAIVRESKDPETLVQARIGLSAVYLEQGSPRQALRVLDDVALAGMGAGWEATVLQQQTACLVELGEGKQAEQRWRALAEAYPEDADLQARAQLALGDLAFGRDAWSEAIAAYDAVLAGSNDRFYLARALLGKGQALTAQGKEREAERVYAEILEVYPEQGELVAIARAAMDG